MQPEAVPRAVKQAANHPLRAGVLAPNLRHVPAARGFGKGVRHGSRIAEEAGPHNPTGEKPLGPLRMARITRKGRNR